MYGIPLILALDIMNIIIFSLAGIIIVGGWVAKAIKNVSGSGGGGGSTSTGTRQRLDELAARRREQLQQLARQRRGQTGSEPTNLSMAERIQRARAKGDYEKRAQRLRSQQAEPARTGEMEARVAAEREARASAQREAQVRQQRVEEHRRQELQRQAQLREQKRRAQLRQQQQQRRQRPTPTSHKTLRKLMPSELGKGAREVDTEQHSLTGSDESSRVHRHVPDAVMLVEHHAARRIQFNARSLRQAIILKELLDPPVALRQNHS